MSATNRGAVRRERDYYPTPEWCTEAIVRRLRWPGCPAILEPCRGDGAIIRVLKRYGFSDIEWAEIADGRDFLTWDFGRQFDFVITNPPFSLARQFIDRSLELADCVVMLLPLSFLASKRRRNWWRSGREPTALHVLSRRPSFTGDNRTDATDYAWYVWDKTGRQDAGIFWL